MIFFQFTTYCELEHHRSSTKIHIELNWLTRLSCLYSHHCLPKFKKGNQSWSHCILQVTTTTFERWLWTLNDWFPELLTVLLNLDWQYNTHDQSLHLFDKKLATMFIDMYLCIFSAKCKPGFFEVMPFLWQVVFLSTYVTEREKRNTNQNVKTCEV